MTCEHEGCQAACNNERWAKTKAHDAGWFFSRSGRAWCPEHVPSWVPMWRERRP